MAGFKKAKAEQAALKIGIYGPSGSGKTFSTLLFSEGLAKITGKRIAFVDTERGTDFYCKEVVDRKIHPTAFDFDALYTRSITETIDSIKSLSVNDYSVVVIDSITHIWEAARLAYTGRTTSAGTIPFQAWAKIKKPYKDLMNTLLSMPMHVFILGRQGNEFDEDEETGELKKIGVKMKAEGETPYEPHILLRMEAVKNTKTNICTITAFAEKDRTGVLAGKTIANPTFDSVIKPLLPLLGDTQAVVQSEDDVAATDGDAIAMKDAEKVKASGEILRRMTAKILASENLEQLKIAGKEITPELKRQMLSADVDALRNKYLEAEAFIK